MEKFQAVLGGFREGLGIGPSKLLRCWCPSGVFSEKQPSPLPLPLTRTLATEFKCPDYTAPAALGFRCVYMCVVSIGIGAGRDGTC